MGETLFAQPSFMGGAARILDLGGVFDDYNFSKSGDEADAIALAMDWQATGQHLRSAMVTILADQSRQAELPL